MTAQFRAFLTDGDYARLRTHFHSAQAPVLTHEAEDRKIAAAIATLPKELQVKVFRDVPYDLQQRMKVWEPAELAPVYWDQFGGRDTAAFLQAIGGNEAQRLRWLREFYVMLTAMFWDVGNYRYVWRVEPLKRMMWWDDPSARPFHFGPMHPPREVPLTEGSSEWTLQIPLPLRMSEEFADETVFTICRRLIHLHFSEQDLALVVQDNQQFGEMRAGLRIFVWVVRDCSIPGALPALRYEELFHAFLLEYIFNPAAPPWRWTPFLVPKEEGGFGGFGSRFIDTADEDLFAYWVDRAWSPFNMRQSSPAFGGQVPKLRTSLPALIPMNAYFLKFLFEVSLNTPETSFTAVFDWSDAVPEGRQGRGGAVVWIGVGLPLQAIARGFYPRTLWQLLNLLGAIAVLAAQDTPRVVALAAFTRHHPAPPDFMQHPLTGGLLGAFADTVVRDVTQTPRWAIDPDTVTRMHQVLDSTELQDAVGDAQRVEAMRTEVAEVTSFIGEAPWRLPGESLTSK